MQLKWDYASQELWVKTDPHPLEQALTHLLTHARQHMPQGGTMTLHTSRVELRKSELTHADMTPGAYTQLVLQDTGDGMDDETLAHVFEPYHPTREGQKGDLTLATVRYGASSVRAAAASKWTARKGRAASGRSCCRGPTNGRRPRGRSRAARQA